MLLPIIIAIVTIFFGESAPYQVPLFGKETGNRVLVLLDDMGKVQSHSRFFRALTSRGYILTHFQAESPDVVLKQFGVFLYDSIVVLAPTVRDFYSLASEDILDFIENGGNLLLTGDFEISDTMRVIAESCGIAFDRKGYEVFDHFSADLSNNDTSKKSILLRTSPTLPSSMIGRSGDVTSSNSSYSVLYRGIGHRINEVNSGMVVQLVVGNPTTYTLNVDSPADGIHNVGREISLVTALQARNNARIVVSGSVDMFDNSFLQSNNVDNEMFIVHFCMWLFGETGVLRFRDVRHNRIDGSPPDLILHEKMRPDLPQSLYPDPEITRNSLVYRVKDEILYSMIIEEYDSLKKMWRPFIADDVQLEFVMLDPYIRKNMSCERFVGRYEASFTAPDSYGIFKFRVLYRRNGYSIIHSETQVSIRPLKHSEYERFIFSAFPYYSSVFSGVFAFLIFSACFLFSDM